MTDSDRDLLAHAYRDYEAAVKAARAVWPGAGEATVREAAADFLIHVRELRRSGGFVPAVTNPAAPHVGNTELPQNRAEGPRGNPFGPTEKQIAFYQRLAQSSVFTPDERQRALEWLATRATKQTIKDQIDWLKQQVESRKAHTNGRGA